MIYPMMISRSEVLNKQFLDECFSPDYIVGRLYWKERPIHHFKDERSWKIWNTKHSGKIAGSKIKKGNSYYYRTTICNNYFYNHQILWLMYHGFLPAEQEIDHINRISTDNRIENLRVASREQQVWNTGSRRNGQKGVSVDNRRNLWVMQFCIGAIKVRGRFSDKKTATFVYNLLSELNHKDFYSGSNITDIENIVYSEITGKVKEYILSFSDELLASYPEIYDNIFHARENSGKGKVIKGVSFIEAKNKFAAYTTKLAFYDNPVSKNLGYFDTLLDACAARISWENSIKEKYGIHT